MTQLTKNFKLEEFACKCGCKGHLQNRIHANLYNLSVQLEKVRSTFGKPVTILSGYRCPKHNTAVGGKPKSQHLEGMAADIAIAGVKPREIGNWAFNNLCFIGGIGVYEPPGNVFCHLDTRKRVNGAVVDNTVRDAIRWYE